jgi:hypothetical protein
MQISVNGSLVVFQNGSNNAGSFTVNPGDYIYTNAYAYANDDVGTQTCLYVENPQGTLIYNSCDTQFSPGSPSSEAYGNYYPTADGAIAAEIYSV